MGRRINSEEVGRMYENGSSIRRIAEHLGFTYSGIRMRLVRDRVKIIKQPASLKFDMGTLRELYVNQKKSAAETSRALGVSRSTFYRLVRQSGIQLRRRPKLAPAEVRSLYADRGWTIQRIGRQFGVPWATVKRRLLKDGVRIRGRHNYRFSSTEIKELYVVQKMSMAETAAVLGASRSTVWRQLRRDGVQLR